VTKVKCPKAKEWPIANDQALKNGKASEELCFGVTSFPAIRVSIFFQGILYYYF
jgi:hypothetical protein